MSNTSCLGDAASYPQAESSEEELAHLMSDEVCEVCRGLRLPEPKSIITTSAKLRRTAADGCELCQLLQRVLKTTYAATHDLIQDTGNVAVYPAKGGGDGGAASLRLGTGDWRVLMASRTQFHAALGGSCPWPFMISRNGPDENASIRDCATISRGMLKICDTTHTTCGTSTIKQSSSNSEASKFIPKRLLHISSDHTSLRIRLCETASGGLSLKAVSLQYTALSHCWGSMPIIKTTSATISQFETEGIAWASLPKTFQEAITLTSEIGIQYIWIDSLCILQGSVSDWAEQASQMADIFSNAYLTIAANAAQNGQQGLLNRRHTTRKLGVFHNYTAFSVCVRDLIEHEYNAVVGVPAFERHSNSTLRKRAWCLQEELLSTRMIHFTENEIVFVCREATSCECNPHWRSRFELPPIVGTSKDEPIVIWQDLVEHYTERQISFCKDRLPALSSLTHLFAEGSGRYLAGLWESHLPGSLLWLTLRGARPRQEPESQSRPPSWSWASVEGRVSYLRGFQGQKNLAEVLDVRTYPSTVDPRGMVSGGHITIRAPLFPLEGIRKEHATPWKRLLWYQNGMHYHGTSFACSPGWASNLQWLEKDDCCCVLDDDSYEPELLLSDDVFDKPVFLLIIRTFEEHYWIKDLPYPGGYRFLGLLLQPLEDLDQIRTKIMESPESRIPFVRIGFGAMDLSKENGEEALNRFKNQFVTIF